jgi:hypothetical protein
MGSPKWKAAPLGACRRTEGPDLGVVKLLLQDHRVLDTLSSKNKSYYENLIKNIS